MPIMPARVAVTRWLLARGRSRSNTARLRRQGPRHMLAKGAFAGGHFEAELTELMKMGHWGQLGAYYRASDARGAAELGAEAAALICFF